MRLGQNAIPSDHSVACSFGQGPAAKSITSHGLADGSDDASLIMATTSGDREPVQGVEQGTCHIREVMQWHTKPQLRPTDLQTPLLAMISLLLAII